MQIDPDWLEKSRDKATCPLCMMVLLFCITLEPRVE